MVVPLLTLILAHSSDAPACGPSLPRTLFSYEHYPVVGLAQFAAGDLGVVRPTYWRRYLVVAYRYFSDKPLTAGEQVAFAPSPDINPAISADERWLAARARVPGVQALANRIRHDRAVPRGNPQGWQTFENCGDDALTTAAATLERRIDQFGVAHDGVRRWVAAQDRVFSNCGEGSETPAPAEPDLPPVLAADRRYQMAAAHFYALDFVTAEAEFLSIAADSSSPWRDLAPYLAARCLLRRATLESDAIDLLLVARAATQLQRLLDDPSRASLHPAARRLLQFSRSRLTPTAQLRAVANQLATPGAEDFGQNLTDFTYFLDRGQIETGESDLADWVRTFQGGDVDHAVERWRTTKSTPWLVAALVHAPPDHPAAAELREAARAIDRRSAAWPTLTLRRIEEVIALGRIDDARTELDGLLSSLPSSTTASKTVLNLFRQQRFALARDLDEALRFAPRYPVALGYDDNGMTDTLPKDAPDVLFAADAVRMFNQGLPLDALVRASASSVLPTGLRRQLTLTAWVRAAILERWDIAQQLTPALRTAFPTLAADINQWQAATTDDDRRFAAAYVILRHPRMKPHLLSGLSMRTDLEGIDDLRDNWWCSFSLPVDLDREAYYRATISPSPQVSPRPAPSAIDPPAFLTAAERTRLLTEWQTLQSIETAPNRLAAIVTTYAAAHRMDPRSPEALHLAVRATRFGCTDAGTGARSRAAFQLLHRYWPTSEWAKQTPYWFN